MIDFVQVGLNISKYRKEKKMSQDELAEKLFVTRQALSKWENGTSIPSIDTLLELGNIFEISFEELLCLDKKEEMDVDPEDIFKGKDRNLVLKKIVNGELKLNIPDVLYQLSPTERMAVLKAIKDKHISIENADNLYAKLTIYEKKYLGGSILWKNI